MKKVSALVLVFCMVFALAACGNSSSSAAPVSSAPSQAAESTTPESTGDILIALSMHNQTADWAVQFKDTFLECAKEADVEVTWNDANEDAATQVNNIDDLVAQDPNALVVVPQDYTALGQALQTAYDAGIPIVNADSKVDEADQHRISSFITADCYAGGYTAGEYLADVLPEGATVGTLNYPQIAVIADRFIGMQDAFDDLGRDDIIVIEKVVTDLNAIATYTEDMLMANPEISAFLCLNDNTALSCYGTCAQMGYEDCIVIGFDGSPAAKQSIANGDMTGSLVYSPVDLAKNSFDAAYAYATGGTYEKEVQVPMWLISPENIDERDLDNWE